MRPNLQRPDRASPADLALCRAMIRSGSRSFYRASLLLPERIRAGAYGLYAFCRLSDDAVDEEKGGEAAVQRLTARLDQVYAGAPADGAVDRALCDAVERYGLPRPLFDALLEGLAWDAQGRVIETESDLYAYATRVAGAVGAMMAVLMGAREPHLIARAIDLGVAMQLTNIARDIGEDARARRLYMPRTWMRDEALDPAAWMESPALSPALIAIIRRLLTRADEFYARADAGIAALPAPVQPAIRLARALYAEIGRELERRNLDSIAARTVVPRRRKLGLVLATLITPPVRARAADALFAPALAEASFLVDAVKHAPLDQSSAMVGGVEWSIALFAALDSRPRRSA